MKKLLTPCSRYFGWALLLFILSVTGMIVWFQTAPPDLEFLTPRIQTHLARFEPEYRITFDSVRLSWPGWQFNPRVRIEDIRVQRHDTPAIRIPDLLVTLNFGRLLRGEIAPVRITAESPRLRLAALGIGLPETSKSPEDPEADLDNRIPEIITRTLSKAVFTIPGLREREPDLREITIEDAVLISEGNEDGDPLLIPEIKLSLHLPLSGDLNLTIDGKTTSADSPSRLQLTARISSEKDTAETEIHLTGFNPSKWARIFPGMDRFQGYRLAFSADFSGTIHKSGQIESGRFTVTNSGGRISDPDLFEQSVKIDKLQARGRFSENLHRWTVETFILKLDGPSLSASGSIIPFGGFPTILLDARVADVSLADLEKYWPLSLKPKIRRWIGTHLLAGRVDQATARFRFHPEDFQTDPLPRSTLDITLPFSGVTLKYHDPMAEIRQIAGTARISGRGVGIDVRGGLTYGSHIEKGWVDIQWIPGPPDIEIQAVVTGPADRLREAVGDLIKVEQVPFHASEGSARTELQFQFPLKGFTPEEFIYRAESELTGLLVSDIFRFSWSQENLSAVLQPGLLMVSGTGGQVSHPQNLARPAAIPEFQMKGRILEKPPGIEVASFSADLGGPILRASGLVLRQTDFPEVDLSLHVNRLSLQEALLYWPLDLAETARSWIASRFSAGEIVDARVRLDLEPRHFTLAELLPNAVEAVIPFRGVSLDYFPTLPKLESAGGIATLGTDGIRIEVNQGRVGRSRLASGRVNILAWERKTPALKIHSTLQGPANDLIDTVAEWMKDPDLDPPRFDSASAETRLEIEYPLGDEHVWRDIKISAETDINAIRIADLFGFQIEDGYLRANLGAGKLVFTGGVRTDSIPFDLQGHFMVDAPAGTDIDRGTGVAGEGLIRLQATVHDQDLPQLGLPRLPFLTGSAEITTRIQIAPSSTDITLAADLQHTRIDLSPAGWTKPAGENATLEIHVRPESEEKLRFSKIRFSADEARISGFGHIQRGSPRRAEFRLDRLEMGRNRLKMDYAFADGRSDVSIRGSVLDAAPLITGSIAEEKGAAEPKTKDGLFFLNSAGENEFTGSVSADLDQMRLANGRLLHGLTARTEWNGGRLLTANLEAAFPEGEKVHIGFSPEQTGRLLSIHSADGGRLLNGLNLTENLIGGELGVAAHFAGPIPTDQPARADVSLRRFSLVNAPILMQILSMASFVGLVGQLESGGIQFDLLQALLTYDDSVLTLQEAILEGISLGITTEGTLDLKEQILDLEGMVIPFNVLNRIVDKIPLLGKFIVGDGILATQYSLKGPFHRPRVSIDPLSTLQVGFLRDIFGKFKLHRLESSAEGSAPVRARGR